MLIRRSSAPTTLLLLVAVASLLHVARALACGDAYDHCMKPNLDALPPAGASRTYFECLRAGGFVYKESASTYVPQPDAPGFPRGVMNQTAVACGCYEENLQCLVPFLKLCPSSSNIWALLEEIQQSCHKTCRAFQPSTACCLTAAAKEDIHGVSSPAAAFTSTCSGLDD